MTFDLTINWGHVLTGIGLALGAVGIVYAIKGDVRLLKAELDGMRQQISKITDVLIHLGRQEERLNSHAQRIQKLEDRDG
jgi:aspartyl aminopeptidase